MDEGRKMLEEELAEFVEDLRTTDEVAQIILNGHLYIEQQLEEIIRCIFFHPDYVLKDNRLGFGRKVQIVRGWSAAHDHPDWKFFEMLNATRNEIAHKRPGEHRKHRIDDLRAAHHARLLPTAKSAFEKSDDATVALAFITMCAGFLEHIKEDIADLRHHIDEMVRAEKAAKRNSN